MTALGAKSATLILASNPQCSCRQTSDLRTRYTCRCAGDLGIPLIVTFKQLALLPRKYKLEKIGNNNP